MQRAIVNQGWHLNEGVLVTGAERHTDPRGVFQEIYRASSAAPSFTIKQVSQTVSRKDTVRGFHVTAIPPGQGKIITCVSGSIVDVALDVRLGSPTFGDHLCVPLSPESGASVYLAPGIAHAYVAKEDTSCVIYLHDAEYAPQHEYEIQAFDAALGIEWGTMSAIRSVKDQNAPTLADAVSAGILPYYGTREEQPR